MVGRRVLAGVVALAWLLAACTEQSRVAPDATIGVRGVVLDASGAPLADRPVQLGSGVTDAEGLTGALSLGLVCLGGVCSGDAFDASTGADGTYSFALRGSDTQSAFGEATSFLLSTSGEPPAGRPTGPSVGARFRIQTEGVRLPDLRLVDPLPALAASGGAVRLTWGSGAAPGPVAAELVTDAEVVWRAATAATAVEVDGRVLEDAVGVAVLSGQVADRVEGSDVTITWTSSGVGFAGGYGAPPSRGARCVLLAADGASRPVDPCGLTDGSFKAASLPTHVCPSAATSTSATAACPPVEWVRVELAAAVPADLLVVRGCADACRLRLVVDGVEAPVDQQASGPFATVALGGAPVSAVDVAAADVARLAELSVWAPTGGGEPLRTPVADGDVLGRAEADDEVPAAAVAVAVAALLGAAAGSVVVHRVLARRGAGALATSSPRS